MSCEIVLGDWGHEIQVELVECNDDGSDGGFLDVSTAISVELLMTKPDPAKTVVVKVMSNVTNGTNGLVKYITETGLIDTLGIWKLKVRTTFADGRFTTQKAADLVVVSE